jgi:glycosyltransferase involved in cell wall biosynthesis
MACGTPVIAMNRGSMPELIENGVNCLLVSSVEEAVRAVGEVGKIDRARCREVVEKRFTAGRMADNYIEVYKKILEKKNEELGMWN